LPFLGQAQLVTVNIVGTNYPVEFKDSNLLVKNRQRIASDLNVVFSIATSFDDLKGEEVETGVFQLGDSLMFLSDEEENIFVVEKNNKTSIRVNKVVSDKYLQAFAWMDANTNVVQKAREFVAILNKPDLLTQPLQVLLDLGHTVPLSLVEENVPPDDAETRAMVAKDFFPYKYPGVSALNFYRKKVSALDFAEIPLMYLWAVDKSDPTGMDAVPVGFYKGKWGFGNFPAPD